MPSINDLPTELLVHIFSFYIVSQGHHKFLCNIPRVCKRWNDLRSTPILWNYIYYPRGIGLNEQWSLGQLKKLSERRLLSSVRYLELHDAWYRESDVTEVLRYCFNLRHLKARNINKVAIEMLAVQCPDIVKLDITFSAPESNIEDALAPFLRVRGHNLTHLTISCKGNEFVSTIARHCHSLERLTIMSRHSFPNVQVPIDEIVVGCPKLRKLHLSECDLVPSEVRDHKGFEKMVRICAWRTRFGGLDLYSILKSSKDLEVIDIEACQNVVLHNLLKVPSEKVNYVEIVDQNLYGCPSDFVEKVVVKWRCSLTTLRLRGIKREVTTVLEAYLQDNPNPKLQLLDLKRSGCVNTQVLKRVMQACRSLQYVHYVYLENGEWIQLHEREDVENFCAA